MRRGRLARLLAGTVLSALTVGMVGTAQPASAEPIVLD